jgi:small subunit ribosomal protein S3
LIKREFNPKSCKNRYPITGKIINFSKTIARDNLLDPELKHKNRKTEPPKREVFINIREIKEPLKEAKLVALGIVSQLERRVSFRRAMKKMLERASELNIPGMKIAVSGRLGGAEIARTEWYLHGRVPLHTLKADVDFAIEEAKTTYGIIGVKVWVYRGEMNLDSNLGREMVAAE